MIAGSHPDPKVRWFHSRRFCLRQDEGPDVARASGDSGFVAHLTASTQGATGWDWSFHLVRPGHGWAFVSDGRLTVYVDEPGDYVPGDAAPGDQVALRLPRARENLHPRRFTLYGGQGGCVTSHGFAKLFLPLRFEAAATLVEALASKWGDQLRFALHVANSPLDFERADAAVLDVGLNDEAGVVRVLEAFLRQEPDALVPRGLPWTTVEGPLGLARAQVTQAGDLADGYGWRRCADAVLGNPVRP